MKLEGRLHRGSKAALNTIIPVQTSGGSDYTLPAGTKKVLVTLNPTEDIYIYRSPNYGNTDVNFFLCNSGNTKRVLICMISVTGGSPIKSGSIPSNQSEQLKDLSTLAGQKLYARFETVNGSGFSFVDNLPINIRSPYTAVVQGNKIVTGDINQTGTSITSGTVMQNSKFSRGTKAEASTFNSQVLEL